MKYEVRCCCCAPRKLLGWLDAPEGVNSWQWALLQPAPWNRVTQLDQVMIPINRIKLPITLISFGDLRYFAIKAEGVEIETLRTIVGFVEAPQ